LVQQAREKGGGELNSQFHFENSNLSSSSSSQPTKDLLLIRKESRSKKFTSRLPFPQIGGHKCLRFVEAINNAGAKWKKRVGSSEGVVTGSSEGLEEDRRAAQISVKAQPVEDQVDPNPVLSSSGLNVILAEAHLDDVDGFVTNREEAVAKISEAEHILQIQTDLGLNFVENNQRTVERLIQLEDRDREELNRDVEVQGFQ
jgi:hypothetical protein